MPAIPESAHLQTFQYVLKNNLKKYRKFIIENGTTPVEFEKKPQFATDTLVYYSEVLKFMCYDAESQFGNSVLYKLANFIILCMQSDEFKDSDFLPFTQYDLASAVGASRIQVARECATLKQQGYIDVKKGKLFVLNPSYFFDVLMTEK